MKTMHHLRVAGLFALAFSATELAAQQAERFSIAGNEVAIYNLVGSVSVEAGTGANVTVEVRRNGRDAARLQIEQKNVDGRAALVVRYPEGDIVYGSQRWQGRTTMDVRSDGTFGDQEGRDRRVNIRSSGDGTEAHADLRILVPAGKAVDVRLGVGEVSATGVNGNLDIDVAAASVRTSNTRGILLIDTGSGSVAVTDVEGDVTIDTGSGGVDVNGVRGNVNVDTGSGSVNGSGITATSVMVDTGSGGIELTNVAASTVELDTGSGSVQLDLTTDVERLTIDTGSGGVRVLVPANLGASVEMESGSGGVTSDIPMTVRQRGRDHLSGQIGDGRGTITIETGSGGIRIGRR